jgi:flagellar motor protein MotB
MRELFKRARSFPSSEVTQEGRGVVLSLRGLYRKGKLVGSKRFLIERVAELINEFGGLRVMIEAHTSKHKKRRAALAKTERMAEEVLTLIKPLIKDPDLRMNTLGRGDYAPISSNPRSIENERIDIVFFNPRLP